MGTAYACRILWITPLCQASALHNIRYGVSHFHKLSPSRYLLLWDGTLLEELNDVI